MAIASGRLPDEAAGPVAEVGRGCGVALIDWAAIARSPELPTHFEHVVVIDPPPHPHLERLVSAARQGQATDPGFLHLAWGQPEIDLALRVHEAEWPSRESLADLYRQLRACDHDPLALLQGPGRHPRSPEVVARRLRVLEELGTVRWESSGTARTPRVVSSEGKNLEHSQAFVAYRERDREGQRFLSRRRQPS
jgi:hypothetical protein